MDLRLWFQYKAARIGHVWIHRVDGRPPVLETLRPSGRDFGTVWANLGIMGLRYIRAPIYPMGDVGTSHDMWLSVKL